jgi:hypothetical protein
MILGVYIFIKKGRQFVFRRDIAPIDDATREEIDTTLMKIVNQFNTYEEGFYRVPLQNDKKILFAVYGEVLSIILIKIEPIAEEEPLGSDSKDASDALFASIVFNQPLLTELIKKEAGKEKFSFYSKKLPEEKKQTPPPAKLEYKAKTQKYVEELDTIIGEVNTKLSENLKETEITPTKEPLTIQAVFSNFTELTFRYARMYLMENLIRDLLEDHAGHPITEIKMGVNDFLFYFRKSIQVMKERPEVKYFLKIMDGQKLGIKIKDRTSFTVSFSGDLIEITNELSKENPLIYIGSTEMVINLILGKLDVLKIALSKNVVATQLHKIVKWAAPFAAILIRIYENRLDAKEVSIKQLTLEGLAQLIQALFSANLENNAQKRAWIKGIQKVIALNFIDIGTLTLIINGEKTDVQIGQGAREPDVILQGHLEDICLYANGEVGFFTVLRKIKLLKGISMNPIDFIKGKTFSQLRELFTLWRLSRI